MRAKKPIIGFGVLASAVLVYAAILLYSPLPFQVIDRDSSGVVSVFEAIDALDIGKRDITDKPGCTEYYWLKDGLPAYENCAK